MAENQINFFTIEDVWNEKDKSLPADCTKIYDPQLFWDNFGDRYYKSHEKREHMQFGLNGNNPVAWLIFKLESLKIDTLLEPGCGFARLAPFILDANAAKEYYGVDFSEKILSCSETYLKDYSKREKIHLQYSSAKKMPFPDKSMDVVMCSELLTHMTFAKANICIREFARIAKKYVIVLERFVYDGEHPYPYIWSHNLIELFKNSGLTILESKMIGNGIMASILEV